MRFAPIRAGRFTLALLCAAASLTWSPRASGQTRYTASWTSLDTHNPAPEWFQDAKFGIYYHWGAFATPDVRDGVVPAQHDEQGG